MCDHPKHLIYDGECAMCCHLADLADLLAWPDSPNLPPWVATPEDVGEQAAFFIDCILVLSLSDDVIHTD
jgi:hypothetical protein